MHKLAKAVLTSAEMFLSGLLSMEVQCRLKASDDLDVSCRFCNKHFFGENELFLHMQQAHEQCHICKKAHPDRFVYFKDYNELEGKYLFLPVYTCKCSGKRHKPLAERIVLSVMLGP